MRKKKFSKERFYRRLEAQNKKAVPQPATDWDVMKGCYSDCQIYPAFSNCLDQHDLEMIANSIKKKAEEIRANKPFFNDQDSLNQLDTSCEQPKKLSTINKQFRSRPSPAPPPSENLESSVPDNDSELFGRCLLHMAAIVACALLLCGILQKLSH